MAYINESDILASLDAADIETVKRDEEAESGALFDKAITTAVNYIRDRLKNVFEIDDELEKEEEDRSVTLVEIAVDIAVWKLCKPFESITADGKKYQLYNDAIKNIDKIVDGSLNVGLERIDDTETATVKFGQTDVDIIY